MQGEEGEHERIVLKPRILKCKRLCHSGAMPACLSSHTTSFYFSSFSFPLHLSHSFLTRLSLFLQLFPSHLPPSLKSPLAACHTLITIYFPLRAITLRGLIFFFSHFILLNFWNQPYSLKSVFGGLNYGQCCSPLRMEMRCKALWYFESGFFQKKNLF